MLYAGQHRKPVDSVKCTIDSRGHGQEKTFAKHWCDILSYFRLFTFEGWKDRFVACPGAAALQRSARRDSNLSSGLSKQDHLSRIQTAIRDSHSKRHSKGVHGRKESVRDNGKRYKPIGRTVHWHKRLWTGKRRHGGLVYGHKSIWCLNCCYRNEILWLIPVIVSALQLPFSILNKRLIGLLIDWVREYLDLTEDFMRQYLTNIII